MHSNAQSSPRHALRAAAELGALATGLGLLTLTFIRLPGGGASPAAPSGLRAQFPTLRPIECGPYEILSDAGKADVARVQHVLENLRAQFRQTFAPLIRCEPAAGKLRLVLFNSESDFRSYTCRVAPALLGSAGFYASTDDRIAILNQACSSRFLHVRSQITNRQRRLERWTGVEPAQRFQAAARLDQWRDELDNEARLSTDRLVRHEGAHQLFHVYRIESPQPVEPTWLTEGLAQYCETPQLGAFYQPLADRVARTRDAGTLLPLRTLLNHRHPAGFFALPAEQTELAYAQSWALTYWLMECHREEFFASIRQYQTGAQSQWPVSLESQWQTFVNSL